MPQQARAELRAEEDGPRRLQEARGKVIGDASEDTGASGYSIIVPMGGVAMVNGTSITDTALERKLAAAVKRDPKVAVRVGHASKLPAARLAAIKALLARAGVTTYQLSASIDTELPPKSPQPADTTPTVVLSIDAKGGLVLGARIVADKDLDAELAKLGKTTKKIALRGHATTTYDVIEKLMARCRAAGLTEISFVSP